MGNKEISKLRAISSRANLGVIRQCGECEHWQETIASLRKWIKRKQYFCNYERNGRGELVGKSAKCYMKFLAV